MTQCGIVGYGYWGKIIHKTLLTLNIEPIIYDPILNIGNSNDINVCNNVFIITPVSTHYEICYNFLTKNKNVFCEKVLTCNNHNNNILFNLTKQYNSYLFIDWIFLYNDHVKFIKDLITNNSLGKLKSVNMNRLNMGPVRTDINAKIDLASHDISILYYLLNPKYVTGEWKNYSRNTMSDQHDSCIGLFYMDNTFVQINTSWHYGKKDRSCIFEFEQGFLLWDDTIKSINVNNKEIIITGKPPLENSILSFINKTTNQEDIKNTTLFVEKILCM